MRLLATKHEAQRLLGTSTTVNVDALVQTWVPAAYDVSGQPLFDVIEILHAATPSTVTLIDLDLTGILAALDAWVAPRPEAPAPMDPGPALMAYRGPAAPDFEAAVSESLTGLDPDPVTIETFRRLQRILQGDPAPGSSSEPETP